MINRLLLVGNGFDLAHGLKTSYQDFVSNYFSKINLDKWDDEFLRLHGQGLPLVVSKSFADLLLNLGKTYEKVIFERDHIRTSTINLGNFKNKLFQEICQHVTKGWVDIEWEYFRMLRLQLRRLEHSNPYNDSEINSELLRQARSVNHNLDSITKLLIAYLSGITESIHERKVQELEVIFLGKLIDTQQDLEELSEEFPIKFHSELAKSWVLKKGQTHKAVNPFDKTVLLNFNYTETTKKLYTYFGPFEKINIHGTINQPDSIVFGYGDEMASDYEKLENLNENEFLRHMKSVHYGRNDNYRKLMSFADSKPFQIQIFGHSCGISDRTLLSSLFEHKNCWSIKIYYHQWTNDEGVLKDNYQDIYMNISRHFRDKIAMRNKVVNKVLCQPHPQYK